MTINISVPKSEASMELKPKITVVGIGGAGGNAVNNMIEKQLEGVQFVAANTDSQALKQSKAESTLQLGTTVTEGLGAGSRPDVGRLAAEESLASIMEELNGSHMIFIAAGMGGGTGTGAAPVIAKAAKDKGILTVAVVTKPFQFEGSHRMRLAEGGIEELEQYVDTLIIIPNQNLFRIATEKTTFADAFGMADEVLYSGVRGITDLMVMPGLINLDFADIRTVMAEMGKAMMGTGEASGERRALDAAEAAIANPLLDDMSMMGAKGVLINITGGSDITLFEVDEAANHIRGQVDQDAYIIIGSAFDKELDGVMRVSVVATGIDTEVAQMPRPNILSISNSDSNAAMSNSSDQEYSEKREAITTNVRIAEGGAEEIEHVQSINQSLNSNKVNEDVETPLDEVEQNEKYSLNLSSDAPISEPNDALELNPINQDIKLDDVGQADKKITKGVDPEKHNEDQALQKLPEGTPKVGATDGFIPDEPNNEAEQETVNARNGDPFKLAELSNGSKDKIEEIGSEHQDISLFERVTGSGRAALGRMTSGKAVFETSKMEVKQESFANNLTASREEQDEIKEVSSVAQKTDLNIDESASKSIEPKYEDDDDLLDIPAFLRRQAN